MTPIAPRLLLAAMLSACLASIAPPASAQLSESGGPVSYSADALEYYDAERRLVLIGDVDVVQGDARLRADRVVIYFANSARPAQPTATGAPPAYGSGDIERMDADGDVYFVRPTQSARGDRAVYQTARDEVVFSGNVIVASADNVIRGETMTLDIQTRRTIIRPAAGERVRGVLTQAPSDGENGEEGPANDAGGEQD